MKEYRVQMRCKTDGGSWWYCVQANTPAEAMQEARKLIAQLRNNEIAGEPQEVVQKDEPKKSKPITQRNGRFEVELHGAPSIPTDYSQMHRPAYGGWDLH